MSRRRDTSASPKLTPVNNLKNNCELSFCFVFVSFVFLSVRYTHDEVTIGGLFSEDEVCNAKISHPQALQWTHGSDVYSEEATCCSRKERLLRLLSTTTVIMEKYGIHPILMSGSLLGAIRSNAPIIYDNDGDLAILQEEILKAGKFKFSMMIEEIRRTGAKMSLSYHANCAICGHVKDSVGLSLDFFKFVRQNNTNNDAYRGPHLAGPVKSCLNPAIDFERDIHYFQTNDWHMYGYDNIVRKQDIFPIQKRAYGSTVAYYPAHPENFVKAEIGQCIVSEYRPVHVFYLRMSPFPRIFFVSTLLSVVLCKDYAATIRHNSGVGFHYRRLSFLAASLIVHVNVIFGFLRSGFACVALLGVNAISVAFSRPARSPTFVYRTYWVCVFANIFAGIYEFRDILVVFACWVYEHKYLLRGCE